MIFSRNLKSIPFYLCNEEPVSKYVLGLITALCYVRPGPRETAGFSMYRSMCYFKLTITLKPDMVL